MRNDITRRQFLKVAGIALVAIPLATISKQALASINTKVRAELKYQSSPKDGMSCSACLEFIPGKTDKDAGQCKVIPGDDEISPNGYCTKWNTL